MEITSVNNELVKETAKLQQKKYRDEKNEFLLEGFKAVEEWCNSGLKFKRIFVLKEKASKYLFTGAELILTNEAVLKKISSTVNEPEVVAVAEKINFNKEKIKDAKRVLLLEGIKDAGNFGTIMRSAVAFGVNTIILYGDCVDIYNPKCVRSAVGNFGKISVYLMSKISELDEYFSDFERVATLPKSKNLLKNFETNKPMLLMFGSEADGLSDELINYSTTSVKIEMSENVESLNLSVACSIVLYEI